MKPPAHKRRHRVKRWSFYSHRASVPCTLREIRREDSVARRFLAGLHDWASAAAKASAPTCWRCGDVDLVSMSTVSGQRVCWRCAEALIGQVLDDEEWGDEPNDDHDHSEVA